MADIKKILRQSHKATCGVMEREINVPRARAGVVIRTLRSKGFQVIGKSLGGEKFVKVWFIRRGGF